jgi:small-conductance mechanosensitive channel
VEEATKAIVQTRPLAAMAGMALQLALSGVFLILFYYYLTVVLYAFAETKPFAELLLNYVTGPILVILSTIAGYIPNLVALIIIAFITRYLIRVARVVFQNIEAGHFQIAGFEEQWIWPTFNITRGMIIILALVLAFPYIPGSNSAAFQGLTILLGVMVSLGSNAVVGNLLAGLFAIYRRSTNIGDRIKVGEHVGDVVAIKLMETHLKSIKNELISIPNSKLLNSEVINYSSDVDRRGLLVHSTVGIGYEEPQMKIEKMLIEAARRTKDLKKSPPPFVLRTGLVDYAVNYQINAYTKHGSHLPKILSDLRSSILDVFNENQVQIMTPSYIADPETPKIAPVTETPITMSGENKGANS